MAVLRWENARLRLFQDGIDIGTLFATSFNSKEDFTDDRTKYQGREIPDGDASYNGGSGSMTLERRSGSVNVDNMLDRYQDGVKRRNGLGKITIQASDVQEDGSIVTYRYTNVRPMPGRSGSTGQRLTTTLDFNYDDQQRVA